MKNFFKKDLFTSVFLIFLVLFTLLIYFPSFKLSFLLIDDGQIVKNSRLITSSLSNYHIGQVKNILFESSNGRVRPAYWLIQTGISNLAFYKPQLMHFYRLVLLFITGFLIFISLGRLNIDIRWKMFSLFLFVMNFQNFENFYRLGPAEVYLAIYYLLIVLVVLKEKIHIRDYSVALIASILGCFTKETFFLVSIPLILFFIPTKIKSIKTNKKFVFYIFLVNLVAGFLVALIKLSYGGISGYSDNYKFTFIEMFDHLTNYLQQINHYQYPMIIFFCLFLVYWIQANITKMFNFKNKKNLFFVFFTTEALINLAILLPWKFVLSRYLIIVNLSLIFVFAIALDSSWNIIKKTMMFSSSKRLIIKNIFLILLTPFIFVRSIFPIANFQDWQKTDSELTSGLLRSLSLNIPQNSSVLVNYFKGDANIEIFLETKWHLEEFYNRRDITFVYLDNNNLCAKNNRYILDRTSERFIPADKLRSDNLLLIDSGKYVYAPVNYGEVLKSFKNIERSPNWNQTYKFDWSLYRQKSGTCISNND